MRRLILLAIAIAATIAQPAYAFWEYGHQTIATIALDEVKPATRVSIRWLLKRQALLETPTCPARTIEEAAVWPDCVKTLGDRFAYMYSWHYQDIDICHPFDIKAGCVDGNCASAQIARAQRMVADRKLPPRDRLIALALLAHIVGDIHQPLHVGEHQDRGGNDVKASYGVIAGRTNLHSIWDGLLADRAISSPPPQATGILSQATPAERAAIAEGGVTDWMRQSWEMARDIVYPSVAPGVCEGKLKGRVAMTQAKIVELVPAMRLQVLRGGLRLAKLLDQALDGDHPEVAHPPKPLRAPASE